MRAANKVLQQSKRLVEGQPNRYLKQLILSTAAAGAVACLAGSALAGNTWDGGGANGNWSTLANWDSDTTPVSPTALVFGGTLQLNSNNNLFVAATTFNGITFSAGAGAFTLTGNSITLGGNITNSSTSLQTINLNIATTAVRTITVTAAGGNVVLGGDISGTGGGILMGGSGSLTLLGNNSYTGNTTFAANQTLNINSATAIGGGTLVANGNGTFDNTSAGAVTISNNFNLSNGSPVFTGTKDLSITGTTTISGANRTITTTAGTLTLQTIDADNTGRTFTKLGAGTLAITNAAQTNFQGGFVLSAGTLAVGNNAALGTGPLSLNAGSIQALTAGRILANVTNLQNSSTVSGSQNLEFSGAFTNTGRTLTVTNSALTTISNNLYLSDVSGTGKTLTVAGSGDVTISGKISNFNGSGTAGGVTYTGSGTLLLSNSANDYTGTTTVTSGTVAVGDNAALGTSTISLNGGTLRADTAARSLNNTVTLANSSTLGGSIGLTLSGVFTQSGGSRTLTVNNSAATTLSGNVFLSELTGTGRILTVNGSGPASINGVIANFNGSGTAGSLVYSGSGSLTLGNTNTYTGATSVSSGTLTLSAASAVNTNTLTVSGGALTETVTNALGGTAALVVSGGTATLSQANNYSGTTTVSGGTLNLNAANAIQSSTTITVSSGALNGNTVNGLGASVALSMSGGTTTLLVANASSSATTTLSTGTLVVGDNSAILGRALAITGAATLSATGGGVTLANDITLTNVSAAQISGSQNLTLSGNVTVSGGTRSLNFNNSAVTTLSGNLFLSETSGSGRVLNLAGTGNATISALISNYNGVGGTAGTLNYGGSGVLTLSNTANTQTGGITITTGTVEAALIANGSLNSSIGASANNANNLQFSNGTLRYIGSTNATTDRRFQTNLVTGTVYAAIESSGSGTLDLADTNVSSYGGSGVGKIALLRLGGSSTGNNFYRGILTNPTSSSASLEKVGAGKWNITAASTFSGTTSITGGTLQLGATAGTPSGTAAINSSSGITINGSGAKFLTYSSTAVTAPIILTQGTIGGTGTIATAVTMGTDGILAPGAGPGSQTYSTALTLGAGGTYQVEINSATGTAGNSTAGWDLVNVTGTLTLSSTSGNKFTIDLTSLTAGNVPGNAANFNPVNNYNWMILSANSTISDYAANKFVVSTANFSNGFYGAFSVVRGDTAGGNNTQLFVTYVAPEPGSVGLIGMALPYLLTRRRKVSRAN